MSDGFTPEQYWQALVRGTATYLWFIAMRSLWLVSVARELAEMSKIDPTIRGRWPNFHTALFRFWIWDVRKLLLPKQMKGDRQ